MKEEISATVIFERFYKTGDKNLKIVLKNGNVMEGILVGHFHGDIDEADEITEWHFVPKSEMEAYQSASDDKEKFGWKIKHEEIISVEFT